MLVSLSVRDIVLIDRLDLTFESGLCVLTGETGAGKSILLDALGLALGGRAETRLLRPGAERASVTAAFEPPPDHPAWSVLRDQDLDIEESQLVLRRSLSSDGRSRAFVNDQPASVALLRQLGDCLVEVQGQFEQRGLLDVASHRALLDAFGDLAPRRDKVARCWHDWRRAEDRLRETEEALATASRDEELLRHALEEMAALDPQPGEEAALAERRQLLMHREQLIEAINAALGTLTDSDLGTNGAQGQLGLARRDLERVADKAGGRLAPVLDALARAEAELEEAVLQIQAAAADMEGDGGDLASVEERYFALRDLARKHACEVDELPALAEEMATRLQRIERGDADLAQLRADAAAAAEAYRAGAQALSKARSTAARKLDRAVNAELPALKLEKARFETSVAPLEPAFWSAQGMDRVAFQVATNPGSRPGPLHKIASGGELSRFLLALKVVLATVNPGQTLVFDEVDSGVGGATAHAIGERLERLARERQILVVTHSPQVAARGGHHMRVAKVASKAGTSTQVDALAEAERQEEIARMLAGAEITDEARAAAQRLMRA